MKKNIKLNFMLMSGVLLFGMYSCTPGAQDYSSYVNPFIGTGGHGHTYPGAVVPNGMNFRIPILTAQVVETMVMYC